MTNEEVLKCPNCGGTFRMIDWKKSYTRSKIMSVGLLRDFLDGMPANVTVFVDVGKTEVEQWTSDITCKVENGDVHITGH